MSDITIILTEDLARRITDYLKPCAPSSAIAAEVEQAVRAALPPEYPEGTVARITLGHYTVFGERQGCEWVGANGQPILGAPSNVEPLRVLADDEIAVKRGANDHVANWRNIAETVRVNGMSVAAALANRYADALDAEATS